MAESNAYPGVESIRWLRDHYGDEVVLTEASGETEPYYIAAEFTYGGRAYAALQNASMRKEDEVELFRLVKGDGTVELETIVDEDELEQASEIYDECFYEWAASFRSFCS